MKILEIKTIQDAYKFWAEIKASNIEAVGLLLNSIPNNFLFPWTQRKDSSIIERLNSAGECPVSIEPVYDKLFKQYKYIVNLLGTKDEFVSFETATEYCDDELKRFGYFFKEEK